MKDFAWIYYIILFVVMACLCGASYYWGKEKCVAMLVYNITASFLFVFVQFLARGIW